MLDDDARNQALNAALGFHADIDGDMELVPGEDRDSTYARLEHAVLRTADSFLAWLRGPTRITIQFGTIVNQQTLLPSGSTHTGGPMQLHDNEQVDVTVKPVDAKGFESSDAITYEVSDETIFTVVGATDEDSHTATIVAGLPGSAVLTVTDPTAIDPVTGLALSATLAVDVLAAGATSITVETGTPTPQP